MTASDGKHSIMVARKSRRTTSNSLELDLSQSKPVSLRCQVNPGFARMVFSNSPSQNLQMARPGLGHGLLELSME